MFSSRKQRVWLQILCLSAFVGMVFVGISIAAADDKADKPADKTTDEAKQVDPFAVPDGTPDELYAYIKGLDNARPQNRNRAAIMAFIKKLVVARSQACEKILAADVPVEKKKPAAAILLSTMQMAVRFGNLQAIKALRALPQRFEKMKMPKIAEAARDTLLQVNLQMAMAAVPGAPPLDEVLKDLKKLVEKDPGVGALRMVMSVVSELSQSDKTAESIDLCNWAEKVFGKSKDEEVVARLQIIKGIGRRLQLPGKTMIVKGKTLAGEPYDLATEKGRVVLVQYWATWCGPCLVELTNVLKNYELYHDRGFDVVGISVDEDKAALEEFLEKRKLPWPILLDSEAEQSNAERYGVMGIPQLILVDQQGKVVSLEARGPKLGEELEKLLGPPEKEGSANKDAVEEGSGKK